MSVVLRARGRRDAPGGGALALAPMRKRHLRQVLAIEQQAYPKPWSRAVFESELAQVRDRSRYYAVACAGRDVVGYAGLWFVCDPAGDEAHVTNIVVAPQHRRRGVGRRLMVHLADVAIRSRCVAWTLEVRASSTGAQELYRRFGFAPAGIRKNYYEQAEDAIVMWCHDIDTDAYATRLEGLR